MMSLTLTGMSWVSQVKPDPYKSINLQHIHEKKEKKIVSKQ